MAPERVRRIAPAGRVLAALTFAVLAAGAGESRGETAPHLQRSLRAGEGKIAFVRPGPENFLAGSAGLFLANADGSGVTRLVAGRNILSPAWSRDGRKLAFSCQGGICVVGADGRGLKRLTKPQRCRAGLKTFDWYPSWSPDGRKIAFERRCERNGQRGYLLNPNVYVMNANGTRPRLLFAHGATPSWAPAGGRIAFLLGMGVNCCKLVVRSAAGGPAKVVAAGAAASRPDWSPDGRRLAYEAYWPDQDSFAVWTAGAGGGAPTFVAEGGRPSYSPDGQRLVFEEIDFASSSRGFDGQLYLVNTDGTGRTFLTRGSEPVWQPR